MNFFETFLRDLLLAGAYVGPIFIKSTRGVAILNASEEGVAAILQAHQPASTGAKAVTPISNSAPAGTLPTA